MCDFRGKLLLLLIVRHMNVFAFSKALRAKKCISIALVYKQINNPRSRLSTSEKY